MERGRLYSTRQSTTSPSVFDTRVMGSLPGSSEESCYPLLDGECIGSRQPSKAALVTAFQASNPSLCPCPLKWHSTYPDALFHHSHQTSFFLPWSPNLFQCYAPHTPLISVGFFFFLANLARAGREMGSNAMFYSWESFFFYS